MKTNVAPWERALRILLGAGLVIGALFAFGATETFAYRAFTIAGIVLGLDFIVTGALGFCPLYHMLGWNTLAPQRADVVGQQRTTGRKGS